MNINKEYAAEEIKSALHYAVVFFKWLLLSLATAIVCGGAGCLFHLLIEKATELREVHGFILYFLPLGGVIIAALYHLFKLEKIDGTNYVIDSIRKDGYVPFTMAPGILIATVITHLCGGSAGREGAALQLGGSLGSTLGKLFRLDDKDMHVIVLCGMSAVFTALFGTPLTAVIFVMEVISVGVIYYSAIMPCVFSSVLTYLLTIILNMHPVSYKLVAVPSVTPLTLIQSIGLGIVFSLGSILLCLSFSKGEGLLHKIIKNEYIRVIVGGTAIVGLSVLLGTDYNGAGMGIVNNAILNGEARPEAFILKILFTVITLGCGYKGGEIVPTFFVGATLGCTVAPLFGMDAGFGAALGLVGLFCGATNAPLASIMLSIELFGVDGLPFYAIICSACFMLSGYYSLYKSQIIVYDKLKAIFINRNTK
ncbi:MAG TPA: chloride channel protein [Ruminococcaceae bacterium]|nr:chloride channel protein [Oscillospiraceae bacterium]